MRKKSKYKPRPVILDTMRWVKQGLSTIDSHSAGVELRLKNHAALEAVIKGEAKPFDVDTLIVMSNLATALKRQGVGEEYHDVCIDGADAIESLKERGNKTGRYICTGQELTAIKTLAELHDAQLSIIRVNDLQEAIKTAAREVNKLS